MRRVLLVLMVLAGQVAWAVPCPEGFTAVSTSTLTRQIQHQAKGQPTVCLTSTTFPSFGPTTPTALPIAGAKGAVR